MSDMHLVQKLPPMLTGNELTQALAVLPEYDPDILNQNDARRLMALTDLYRVYVPNQMTKEIYSKLYLALLRSLQKKEGSLRVKQSLENYKAIQRQQFSGILGGADSFTIIGGSGIGKSSAISRALALLTPEQIIETGPLFTRILPCVLVQCPFDASVKGLLLEILRVVDRQLGSCYHAKAATVRATTDMLIGTVSQVCLNHIGILVVDEIQNVATAKNGRNLLGALLQLINCSGISICMVGTPECNDFFTQAMQLARRSLGLQYTAMEYGGEFVTLCQILFRYQYTRHPVKPDTAIIRWLYEHSGGNVSSVVTLLHDAQEISILDGSEVLTVEALEAAYERRMKMLHSYISPTKRPQTSHMQYCENVVLKDSSGMGTISIQKLVQEAKNKGIGVAPYLATFVTLEEVQL